MPTKPSSESVSVQGFDLRWNIYRRGGASTAYENNRGLAVTLSVEPGQTRELRIEFPFGAYFFDMPKQESEFVEKLRDAIAEAIDAGWRPNSRGKAFVFEVKPAAIK